MDSLLKSTKRILISNDDGFRAPGIQQLARRLTHLAEVVIVAPEGPRSGYSSAISINSPLRLRLRHQEDKLSIYSVDGGTPADCIKLALHVLFANELPDLVLSGINHGSNEGIAVMHSGTIGAAKEGAVSGIPSLAISIDDVAEQPDFTYALQYSERIVANLLQDDGLRAYRLLTLNIPKTQPLGLKICRHAVGLYVDQFMVSKNARDQDIYWLSGYQTISEQDQADGDNDFSWLKQGYATLTPLTLDQTDYQALTSLKLVIEER